MIKHSRIFGRLDVFSCTCRDSNMFRDTNLKVTFCFTIINLELNLLLILNATFKLTQGRMSRMVFSKGDLAESGNFPKGLF